MLHPLPATIFGLCWLLLPTGGAADIVKFQADDWVTECNTADQRSDEDCSIIGVFRNTLPDGVKGSFSLLVDLKNHQVAVVGEPAPVRTSLRIDKNPALQCTGTPHCIFARSDADGVTRQLQYGSLILVDVFTAKSLFRFSLSTKGYQAGLAKIQAMGYRPPAG
jgi:hypothetical protein